MEIEEPLSRYRKKPLTKIIANGEFDNLSDSRTFFYKTEKIPRLYQETVASLRKRLDSLSGQTGYAILNFDNDYIGQPAWKIMESLVSLDIISGESIGINELRHNDAPWFFQVHLQVKYPPNITEGREMNKTIGHGFGKDLNDNFSKAIGEVLERYFLTLYHKRKLIRGSVQSLGRKKTPVLDLNLLSGFSDKQKETNPRLQFDEKSVFYWEKVKQISAGETVWAPAQLVYWNYAQSEFEPYLVEGNTNGAGGWFTQEGAILSGLYELIQRDGFLIYWLNKLTPQSIDPYTIPHQEFQQLLEESERYGFEVYCLNLTSDIGAPAFAVIIGDPTGKGPRFSLGAGCQADPARALWRAIEEAWATHYWIRPKPIFKILGNDYQPFREKIGQEDRLRLWANPEMAKQMDFFISGKKLAFSDLNIDYPKSFSSQKEELDFLVKKIESLGPGYEVYAYAPEHPVLKQLGYHSAQVIVPQLVPLYLHEFNAPLGSRRLKEVPKELGFSAAAQFNPLPHLFP